MNETWWVNYGPEPSFGIRLLGSDTPEKLVADGWFEVPAALGRQMWDYARVMALKVDEAREERL